jgi:hypothetical protein
MFCDTKNVTYSNGLRNVIWKKYHPRKQEDKIIVEGWNTMEGCVDFMNEMSDAIFGMHLPGYGYTSRYLVLAFHL